MSDKFKVFKPRRGTRTVMANAKKNTILSSGELFIEVPDSGPGTGKSKVKMGDGVTPYAELPYMLGGDVSLEEFNYTPNTSKTPNDALKATASGNELGAIIAGMRQAAMLNDKSILDLSQNILDQGKNITQVQNQINKIIPPGTNTVVLTNVPSDIVGALWYE